MSSDRVPDKSSAAGSAPSDRGIIPDGTEAQLSARARVNTSVSSVAMDRGVLAMTSIASQAQAETATPLPRLAEGLTDAEVMLRVKVGDESAFEYLVQKYRRAMVNFMYRMSHNAAVSEDLAQEVFLRVYRSRSSYEASAKFTTWLYRVATNLAMNHARDTRHERPENMASLYEPDEQTGTTMDMADTSSNVDERMVRQWEHDGIQQ